MTDALDVLNTVNQCQVDQLKRAGQELDPQKDCAVFTRIVLNVQAAVIHTYQMTAVASMREADPKAAAALWKKMSDFCDSALTVIRKVKARYPYCGTPELYDLALDYRREAQKRYVQNLQDSECQTPPPELFATAT
jgi:hypothetical protein